MKSLMAKLSFAITTVCLIAECRSIPVACNYIMDFWWQTNAYFYQCNVQNAYDFVGSATEVNSVTGQHSSGKSDDSVESIYMPNIPILTKFPTGLNVVFKNLILLFFSSSNISEITSGDLKVFPKLRFLYFDGSSIEVIREDTLSFNPLLEVVYFGGSKIVHIDSRALSSLNNLRALQVSGGSCSFLGLTRTEVLAAVAQIEQNSCQSDKYATTSAINCQFNTDIFFGMPNRVYQCFVLNVANFQTQRKTITSAVGRHDVGKTNANVESIYFEGGSNPFVIPTGISNVFANINTFTIIRSQLSALTGNDLKVFPKLKFLYVVVNRIEVLREDLLLGNPLLEVINLGENSIAHIDPRTFSHLTQLRALLLYLNVCGFLSVDTRADVVRTVASIEQGYCQSPQYTVTSTTRLTTIPITTTSTTTLRPTTTSTTSTQSTSTTTRPVTTTEDPKIAIISQQQQEIAALRSQLTAQNQELQRLNSTNQMLSIDIMNATAAIKALEEKNRNCTLRSDSVDRLLAKNDEILAKLDRPAGNCSLDEMLKQIGMPAEGSKLVGDCLNVSSLHEQVTRKEEQLGIVITQLDSCNERSKEVIAEREALKAEIGELKKRINGTVLSGSSSMSVTSSASSSSSINSNAIPISSSNASG